MRKLKVEIRNKLLTVCPNVFFESAPDTAPCPYIVYDLTQGLNIGDQTVINMDIDIWDKNKSTVNIDTILDNVKKLNRVNFINEDIQFSLHFDRFINTKSESLEWKRITAIFQVRYMERS